MNQIDLWTVLGCESDRFVKLCLNFYVSLNKLVSYNASSVAAAFKCNGDCFESLQPGCFGSGSTKQT